MIGILPGHPAAAQYYMQLTDLDVYEDANSTSTSGAGLRDGAVISRFTGRFSFGFSDHADPATLAPNITVTGPDGSTLNWRVALQPIH